MAVARRQAIGTARDPSVVIRPGGLVLLRIGDGRDIAERVIADGSCQHGPVRISPMAYLGRRPKIRPRLRGIVVDILGFGQHLATVIGNSLPANLTEIV